MTDFAPLASIRRFYDADNEFVSADPADRDISVMLKELDPDVVVYVPAIRAAVNTDAYAWACIAGKRTVATQPSGW